MREEMAERSWFFAAGGQQQGPYGEAQFRDLIARGTVAADTLVWSEGMANWQKAGEVPGLLSGAVPPPVISRSGCVVTSAAGYGGGALSIDFGILDYVWRTIVFSIGIALIIPAPWVIVWYANWLLSCVHVPGRPNLSFTGQPMTLLPWVIGLAVLYGVIYWVEAQGLSNLMSLVWIVVDWLFIRWFIANLASNGEPIGLKFAGSFWAYLGWSILFGLSVLTIIGWAWVAVAMMRWYCRSIEGARRQIVFKGTGLEYLWRGIVTVIASAFIIPIPWVARWMAGWVASQTQLVE
jgi:GYF domain 2